MKRPSQWQCMVLLVPRNCACRVMRTLAVLAALGMGLLAAPSAKAQAYLSTTLYSFTGLIVDGAYPIGGLIMDASGNLYGTASGSAFSLTGTGMVFELVNSSGKYSEKVLYRFGSGSSGDGAYPESSLIMDASGNLYGTTWGGGFGGGGSVFELVNSSGTYSEKVLYSFAGGSGSGLQPQASLIMDASGNLYGTTDNGGASGYGTVFELVNSSGTYSEKVLHSFTNSGGDGANTLGRLLMDGSGNLYGTTYGGGASGYGTVFELVNSSGTYTEKVLFSFTGAGGSYPEAGVVMDASGNLYGTTFSGGASNYGTVFELINSSGTYSEKVLYSFTNSVGDGGNPHGGLVMDASGNLYGATVNGGIGYSGTVFELINSSGTYSEKVLHSFVPNGCGADGVNPEASLIMDTSGNFYGTTFSGGASNYGSVFDLTSIPSPAATTTTLTSSLNPAGADAPVTLTATVSSSLAVLPTGTVTFSGGGSQVGTAPLACNGSATLSLDDALELGIGASSITAQYTPNVTGFAPSSGSLVQTVNEPGVALTSGNNTFNGNQNVNGAVNATSFSGNGGGLTNLNPANLGPGTAAINITGNAATATMATLAATATTASNADNAANAAKLGGVAAGSYARLDVANTFTGNQTVTGSLTIGGGSPIVESVSITTSVTLPAISKSSCTTLTTGPVTGFTPGATDTIALGVPQALTSPGGGVSLIYQAWETTTTTSPTITINVCNPTGTDYAGGGTGTIRADIFKH